MTMIMNKATYVAKNGREFKMVYSEEKRIIEVFTDGTLHLTIVDVAPEESTAQMNSFMESWNYANPA
jgi:hypothetical protein